MAPVHTWPPTLHDLKVALGVPDPDSPRPEDERMTNALIDAIDYVQGRRPTFNYTGDITDCNPPPTDRLWGGTVALAARWDKRHNSVDGLVALGDMGTTRVPSVDPDIERRLGIGRFAGPVTA
jgi:hypothetical protein